MKHMIAIALAAVVTASTTAHADDDQPRSPETATWLSTGSTIAGWALIGGAFATFDPNGAHSFQHDRATWLLGTSGALLAIVGPSAGHIYAGEYGHAAGFSVARLLLGGAGTFAVAACALGGDCKLAPIGAIAIGALTIYDLHDAPAAARRYDAAHDELQVVPLIMRDAASHEALGAGIVGTF